MFTSDKSIGILIKQVAASVSWAVINGLCSHIIVKCRCCCCCKNGVSLYIRHHALFHQYWWLDTLHTNKFLGMNTKVHVNDEFSCKWKFLTTTFALQILHTQRNITMDTDLQQAQTWLIKTYTYLSAQDTASKSQVPLSLELRIFYVVQLRSQLHCSLSSCWVASLQL